VRVVSSKGALRRGYVIHASNQLQTRPENLELGEVLDMPEFETYSLLASAVFGEDKPGAASAVEDEWSGCLRPIDGYIERLAGTKDGKPLERYRKVRSQVLWPDPWHVYKEFFNALTNPELNKHQTTLKDVIKEFGGEDNSTTVQIMIEGQWKDLDDCLLQAGETAAQYLATMTETRRELGLASTE